MCWHGMNGIDRVDCPEDEALDGYCGAYNSFLCPGNPGGRCVYDEIEDNLHDGYWRGYGWGFGPTCYRYLRHMESNEIWAVKTYCGKVVSAHGPVNPSKWKFKDLPNFDYDAEAGLKIERDQRNFEEIDLNNPNWPKKVF